MTADVSTQTVCHFREVLFWPVQLMPLAEDMKTKLLSAVMDILADDLISMRTRLSLPGKP